jgi:hypothetical protein
MGASGGGWVLPRVDDLLISNCRLHCGGEIGLAFWKLDLEKLCQWTIAWEDRRISKF